MNKVLQLSVPDPQAAGAPNAISRTAYYTLAVRAWDAAQPTPVCGDAYAASLMNEDARAIWDQFKSFRKPNASNATRHALIDEHLRRELRADPGARVVVVGAGFDTRAFRLAGGHWIEVDEPAVISYKESRLPATRAPNPLTRLSIQFMRESLAEKLAPVAGTERTHIVVEGVLMYLTHIQRVELLQALRKCYPHHVLYVDLMRKSFFESYSREVHEKIVGLGTHFSDMTERPEQLLADAGYTSLACTSIPLAAAERGAVAIPAVVVRWFLGKLRRGYSVWKWELPSAGKQPVDPQKSPMGAHHE